MPHGRRYWERLTRWDRLYLAGFILVALLCLWKAPLAPASHDEGFYLTIPKRLLDGDIFFVDEWHGSQLAALLTYPLIWLHRLLFGFDGVVLHARYLYVLFQALTSAALYVCLCRRGPFALPASLYFFLFTPFDIMALSYNTMGLMLVALTGALLAVARRPRTFLFAGVLFAGAVLCCPHLLLGYALYTVAALGYAVAAREKGGAVAIRWAAFTLGGGICAILLLLFILTRASFSEVWRALPMLFSDPEHPQRFLRRMPLVAYGSSVAKIVPWGTVGFGVYGLALAAAAVDKKRAKHKLVYLGLSAAIALAMLIQLAPELTVSTYNFIMFPLALVGLMAFVVTKARNLRVFLFLYLGGIVYTLCIFVASNNGEYVLTAMSTVANVGSILLMGDAVAEARAENRRLFCGLCAVLAVLLAAQYSLMIYTKIHHKFCSTLDNSAYTQVIGEGPCKGLHVAPAAEAAYLEELDMLRPMLQKEGRVLYAAERPWYYLATPQLGVGAYSAWLSGETDFTIDRLAIYYEQNPEKVPEHILIPAGEEWDMAYLRQRILDPYDYTQADYEGAALYSRATR